MATTKKKYSDIDLSKYNSGYKASNDVLNAQNLKTQAEDALKNLGSFNYKNQAAYDNAMNAILNRKKFSYDINGDALYQQYKDQYTTQGKQAMMDTIGQASALTGGYGNSYAATVGNQTYQGYLQQLNDKIPELYNLALNSYNAEGDRLNANYNLLAADQEVERALYADKYNQLAADRSYYSDNYNNAYNQDYTTWNDNRTYDTSQYWNEYNTGYQAERDAIADTQWQQQYEAEQTWKQKEFDEAVRQYNETMAFNKAQAAKSGSGGGNGGNTPSLKTPTDAMFDAALRAYSSGGQTALEQYADRYPEYDYEALFDYATRYGSYTEPRNVINKTNYRTSGSSRDTFDSNVRSNYANRKK